MPKDTKCRILDLPLEILWLVIGYLEREDLRQFSSCSKACFNLALRPGDRIICFNKYSRKNWGEYMRRFDEGQLWAPLRSSIRSAVFDFPQVGDLYAPLASIYRFPNITSLTIRIGGCANLERNLYVRTLICLSKLPFYDNLQHLALEWQPGENKFDSARPHEIPDYYRNHSHRCEGADDYMRQVFQWTQANTDDNGFLGCFVSARALAKLIRRGKINFPRRLESYAFKCDVLESEAAFYQPLRRCKALTTLRIKGPMESNEKDYTKGTRISRPPYSGTDFGAGDVPIVKFPNIKALMLEFRTDNDDSRYESPEFTVQQFPNLRLLVLDDYDDMDSPSCFPHLRNLEFLTLRYSYNIDADEANWIVYSLKRELWERGGLPPLNFKVVTLCCPENKYSFAVEWIKAQDSDILGEHLEFEFRSLPPRDDTQDQQHPYIPGFEAYGACWWNTEDSNEFDIEDSMDAQEWDSDHSDRSTKIKEWSSEFDTEFERIDEDEAYNLRKIKIKQFRKEVRTEGKSKRQRQRIARQIGEPEETENRSDTPSDSENNHDDNLYSYKRMCFEQPDETMDPDSADSGGEEQDEHLDDEIGHIVSQETHIRDNMDPEDSDEYGDDERDDDSEGSLQDAGFQDPEFDLPLDEGSLYISKYGIEEESSQK